MNAWAATLLGDARHVRCTIEHLDPVGQVIDTRSFPLSDLDLAPLDVIYGVGEPHERDNGEASVAIEVRVLDRARHGSASVAPGAQLRIRHARPLDLAANELTLLDTIEQARAARALFGAAQPATLEVGPTRAADNSVIDLAELEARVTRAEDALLAAHAEDS